MSLPHRHAFHRPTQFNSLDPHGRSVGTARFDAGGNKIDGEYNERGEPIGSPDRHNLPLSKNTMTAEDSWRKTFPNTAAAATSILPLGIVNGAARIASDIIPKPPGFPAPTPTTSPAEPRPSAGISAAIDRAASSAASTGFPGPSRVAPAPTNPVSTRMSPTPTTIPAATSASAPPAFAGLRSLQPVVMGGNPADAMRLLRPSALTPSGTPDAAIAKAREGGVGQTAYGPITASIPGAASGSLAATVNPAANAATTAMNPPAIGAGSSLTAKVDAADRSPQPPSLGTGAPSAVSGSVGGSNVFSRVARATVPTIPGQLAVNVLPHVFNYAKQLLGSAPAPSGGSGSGDTPEAAARGAMGLPPAPSNPVAQASGSNPEDVANAAMPFPKPLKRSVALMDKPAQQY